MGKGTNTTTSTNAPNPQAMGAYSQILNQAQGVAQTPFQQYGGEFTAPINPQQQMAGANINANWNEAQPYIGQAGGLLSGAANPLTAGQIANYYNPYQQQVVNATQAQFNNQNQQQQQALLGNAAAQGALGGDRVSVAQALTAGQQQLAQAPVIAGLEQQGYNQALATAGQQYQQNPENVAYGLASTGTAGQNAALTGANAQFGYGSAGQQTQQAQNQALYNQFLMQQAYPFQTAQWLAGIDTGVGSQMGGTSTTTGPAPNLINQIAGLGVGALGLGALMPKGGQQQGQVAARGGRIHGFADGGNPSLGGMPYGGVQGYVPSIQLSPGSGAPKPGAPSNSQQQQQPNYLQQFAQLAPKSGVQIPGFGAGSNVLNPPGSDVAIPGQNVSANFADGTFGSWGNYTAPMLTEADTAAWTAAPEAAAAAGGGDLAALLPFLFLKRGGGIPGFADGGAPEEEDHFVRDPIFNIPWMTKPQYQRQLGERLGEIPAFVAQSVDYLNKGVLQGEPHPFSNNFKPPMERQKLSSPDAGWENPLLSPRGLWEDIGGNNQAWARNWRESQGGPGWAPPSRRELTERNDWASGGGIPGFAHGGHSSVRKARGDPQRWLAEHQGFGGLSFNDRFAGEPHPEHASFRERHAGVRAIGPLHHARGGEVPGFDDGGDVPLPPPRPVGDDLATPAAPAPQAGFNVLNPLGLSKEAGLNLLGFAAGALSSRSPFLGVGIGEGLQGALATQAGQEAQKLKQTQVEQAAKRLEQQASQAQAHLNLQTKEFGLKQQTQAIELRKPVPVAYDRLTGTAILGVPDPHNPGRWLDPTTGTPVQADPRIAPATARGVSAPFATPGAPAAAAPWQPAARADFHPVAYSDPQPAVRTAFGDAEDAAAPLRKFVASDSPSGLNVAALNDPLLPEGLRNKAYQIATGQAAFLPVGRGNKENQYIMQKAYEVNPSLDQTMFPRRQRTENFYAVGTQGGGGQNIVAINRALAHTGSLLATAEKLDESRFPTWNAARNYLARQGLGSQATQDALKDWEVNAKGVGDEWAKVFAGSNTALADRGEWEKVVAAETPLSAMKAALHRAVEMGGQALAANVANYNEGMRTNHDPREFLTPRSRAIFEAILNNKPINDVVAPQRGQGAAAAPSVPGAYPTATNPKTGQKMMFKDGQWQPMQ